MKNINDEVISKNVEFQTIFKDMEIAIIKLMQFMGLITTDAGNILEQNVSKPQFSQQPVVPGMLPGSNPL